MELRYGIKDSELGVKIANALDQDYNHSWVEVKDPIAIDSIMRTYADHASRKILKVTIDVPCTIMDMLESSDIPHSTGYKKVLGLIKNQFLVPYDTIRRDGGRRVPRYISTIKSMKIEINDFSDTIIKVRFSRRVLSKVFPR